MTKQTAQPWTLWNEYSMRAIAASIGHTMNINKMLYQNTELRKYRKCPLLVEMFPFLSSCTGHYLALVLKV